MQSFVKKQINYLLSLIIILSAIHILTVNNTFANEYVFYTVGDNTVEFFNVVNSKSQEAIELPTVDGNHIYVLKSSHIKSNDLEGLTLNTHSLGVFVKKESWLKFRLYTRANINREIALVINGLVIYSATVKEIITKNVIINIFEDKYSRITEILNKFPIGEFPGYLENEDEYIAFLKSHMRLFPNDIGYIAELASSYINKIENDTTDSGAIRSICIEAIPFLKIVYNNNPIMKNSYNNLANCYIETSQFDNAIEIFERILQYEHPNIRWHTLQRLGIAHFGNKSYQKALEVFNEALYHINKYPFLSNNPNLPNVTYDVEIAKFLLKDSIESSYIDKISTINDLEKYIKNKYILSIENLINETKRMIGTVEQTN